MINLPSNETETSLDTDLPMSKLTEQVEDFISGKISGRSLEFRVVVLVGVQDVPGSFNNHNWSSRLSSFNFTVEHRSYNAITTQQKSQNAPIRGISIALTCIVWHSKASTNQRTASGLIWTNERTTHSASSLYLKFCPMICCISLTQPWRSLTLMASSAPLEFHTDISREQFQVQNIKFQTARLDHSIKIANSFAKQ